MNVSPVTSATAAVPAQPPVTGSPASGAATGIPFSRLLTEFLSNANQHQLSIDRHVEDLVSGKTQNIHEVAISVAQADIAFRLVMEVRDQLISAYQDVMRMQV